jgi:hypothetical protein
MAAYLSENKEPLLLVFSSEYYLWQIIAYIKQAFKLLQNAPRARFISATKYLCVCVLLLLLLLCCSFYGSHIILDYIVAIVLWLVKGKLEKICKELPMAESKYRPEICLEEMRKIMNNLSQDRRCSI